METIIITVKQDGTGDVTSIAEAFALAMKTDMALGVEVRIGAGRYKEKLDLERDNVTLVGASAEETIIEFDDYGLFMMPEGVKRGTFRSYTMYVHGDNFTARNLTFKNTAGFGPKVGQAVAVYADGARMTFENCRFTGRQDTLFTAPLPPTVVEWGGFRGPRENEPRDNGTHYYKNCYDNNNAVRPFCITQTVRVGNKPKSERRYKKARNLPGRVNIKEYQWTKTLSQTFRTCIEHIAKQSPERSLIPVLQSFLQWLWKA